MFKGSMVALVTPMLDDGSVDDEARLRKASPRARVRTT